MAELAKLVEELSQLSVLEAADLVKMLEEKWGVSAAAPVAAVAAGPAAAAAVEEVEEKTEFNVIIKNAGPKKIEVIRSSASSRNSLGPTSSTKLEIIFTPLGVVKTPSVRSPPLEEFSFC